MNENDKQAEEAINKIAAAAVRLKTVWDTGAGIDIMALSTIESGSGKLNRLITTARDAGATPR